MAEASAHSRNTALSLGIVIPVLSIMNDTPLLSLLIATVRRRTELERLLLSLRQQEHTCLQIIIADQNPPSFLEDLHAQFSDLPLQIIPVPDKGVSQARNAIIPLAEGSYIAFPDDDCWYATDTLAQVVEAFQRHPEAGAVMGKSIDASPVSPSCGKDAPVSQIGTFKNGETYLQFFRAEVVKDLRFDPRLGPGTGLPYGCGEDTDYLLEAHKRAPVWR